MRQGGHGKKFSLPAQKLRIAEDGRDRLVSAVFTGTPTRHGDDIHQPVLTPEAVDLAFANSGRLPLLWNHYFSLDHLLGAVVSARLEDGAMHVIARLARGGDASRIWRMLRAGFALNMSWGASHRAAEDIGPSPFGGRTYRLIDWEPIEISFVLAGRDPYAHATPIADGFATLARQSAHVTENEAAISYRRLRLDTWRDWVAPAAVEIAQELGHAVGPVSRALERQVDRRIAELLGGKAVEDDADGLLASELAA